MPKILVTGSAGFIGFHLSRSLLEDGFEVCGVDNVNDYYSPQLKMDRTKQLEAYPGYRFERVDIFDRDQLRRVFSEFQPGKVVNLAARPESATA